MINVVIPMAGEGSRFVNKGYKTPKPFIDMAGEPMIKRVLENLYYPDVNFILIARKEHMEQSPDIVAEIKKAFNATFIAIDKLTEGTACTVLFARSFINNDAPLLIANSDQIVDMKIKTFIDDALDRDLDGSILTFIDTDKDAKWSFARLDDNNLVVEVKEKVAISDLATVGIYLFTKGRYFVDAAVDMMVNNDRVNNEFYTCPVYNYSIKEGRKIGVYNINFHQMHGIGTPDDLNRYLKIISTQTS